MQILSFFQHRKHVLSIFAAVAVVTCIGLLVPGKSSLYGQVGPQRIPDLRGLWTGSIHGCGFLDAWAQTNDPMCGGDDTIQLEITLQQGRIFTGQSGDPKDKLTGVLLPDGTVQFQIFQPGNFDHSIAFGTLSIDKGHYVITAYQHGLYDVNRATQPLMYTAQVILRKQ